MMKTWGVALACLLVIAPATVRAQSMIDSDNDGLADDVDPCPAEARNLCYGAPAVDANTGDFVRVNANAGTSECAGTKIDCSGGTWLSDFGYNVQPKVSECDLGGGGEACVIDGIDALFGCADEETEDLFQCEHSDLASDPELAYSFAVGNGEFLVNLYFANTYSGTTMAGDRVFDVAMEGDVVLQGFDQVVAAGGSATAVVRSALVDVSDGVLDIELLHDTENPAVKAIEVLAPGGGPDCGNGAIDGDEECDDGNVSGGDGCAADCTIETGEPEGCSPSYWRRWRNLRQWQGLSPLSRFNDVFDVRYDWNPFFRGTQDSYVYASLWTYGHGCRGLARHAVAALLNAKHSGIDYAYGPAQVRRMVERAFEEGRCNAVKRKLAEQNFGHCPLGD